MALSRTDQLAVLCRGLRDPKVQTLDSITSLSRFHEGSCLLQEIVILIQKGPCLVKPLLHPWFPENTETLFLFPLSALWKFRGNNQEDQQRHFHLL